MHAVLTESLFIDSSDADLLADPDFRQATAVGHAEGIAQFLGLDGAPPPPPSDWAATLTTPEGGFTMSDGWGTSTWSSQKLGSSYRYADPISGQSDAAWFAFDLPETGDYRVEVWHPADPGYNASAPHVIFAGDGTHTVHVDQRANGGRWRDLGTFPFDAGQRDVVAVSRWTTSSGYVIADGVRVSRV